MWVTHICFVLHFENFTKSYISVGNCTGISCAIRIYTWDVTLFVYYVHACMHVKKFSSSQVNVITV